MVATRRLSRCARRMAIGLAVAAFLPAPAFLPTPGAAAPTAPPAPSIERSVAVASYGSGAISKAILKGTDLAPRAAGSVKIAAKQGTVRLAISVRGLPLPASFAPEYLTYVAWAVTAEGRPRNLGEMAGGKGSGKLEVTAPIQSFGLVVTAEPDFASESPSELVVLENEFAGDEAARAALSKASFRAFPRDAFSGPGAGAVDSASGVPNDLMQARNALRIARSFGADSFAADAYARAAQLLAQAEDYARDKKSRKMAGPRAREAVQSAEAARSLAARAIEEARVAEEKADAAARTAAAQTEASEAQARADEEARRRSDAERSAAAAEQARGQAESEKQALRAKLLKQFNMILETRDSARGLIVSLGDVLFDLNRYTLRPAARERLAKLSGIVLGNPGLTLAVEGHADSTGSDEYNQKLSESRAAAVRDYLIEQSVASETITARGFGRTRPVASNSTAQGRQKNRRVEIVVSGDIIGTEAQP